MLLSWSISETADWQPLPLNEDSDGKEVLPSYHFQRVGSPNSKSFVGNQNLKNSVNFSTNVETLQEDATSS
jgi:hypothetical protein